MLFSEIKNIKEFNYICAVHNENEQISEIYCCDLYSNVLENIKGGAVWITVMSSMNAVAIAVLKRVRCIILVEGKRFGEEAIEQAKKNGIGIIYTKKTSYEVADSLVRLTIFSTI